MGLFFFMGAIISKGPLAVKGLIMKVWIKGILIVIFLSIFSAYSAGKENKEDPDQKIMIEEVPDLIISLAYFIRNSEIPKQPDEDFLRAKENKLAIDKKYLALFDMFNAADTKIYFEAHAGFTVNYCKIQINSKGYFCGTTEGDIPDPANSFLYVSEPMQALDNAVLLILSGVSPEGTKIVLIDKNLNVRELYNYKTSPNNFCKTPEHGYVRTIYAVTVEEPNRLILREAGNRPMIEGIRQLELKISPNSCDIIILEETLPEYLFQK